MQHLTEEELVSHYYRDAEPGDVGEHLRDCKECSAQFETMTRVLALVTDAPLPERGSDYEDQVWNRLRWKLGSERRRTAGWLTGLTAAAALALAFFAGHWWSASRPRAATAIPTASTTAAEGRSAAGQSDRVLLIVVGDHLDDSERVLLEVANADPQKDLDVAQESRRAGDLVAANRIYRQTALQRGNERIASVLADLEPVLIEISHAGTTLTRSEVAELQKRIEAKGLLFKVRVISAQTTNPRNENDHQSNHI